MGASILEPVPSEEFLEQESLNFFVMFIFSLLKNIFSYLEKHLAYWVKIDRIKIHRNIFQSHSKGKTGKINR